MSKTPISKIILAGIPVAVCASLGANAYAADFTVSTPSELVSAIAEIQTGENETHTITLGGDIVFTSNDNISAPFLINNGNTVTLLGNGHSIRFGKDDNKIVINEAKLNLGGDGKELTLYGPGEEATADDPLITLYSGSTLNMASAVTLRENYGENGDATCGAVLVLDGSTFNMNGGTIEKNSASANSGYGGAINVDGQNAKLNIDGGKFYSNTAGIYGGAIYANDATVSIKNASFQWNSTPDGYGGAIVLFEGATATIEDSDFTENSAGNYPGAIANFCSVMTVTRTSFIDNRSGSWGGAIMTGCDDDVATTTIKDSLFHGNSADSYGGAIMQLSGTLSSEGTTYDENTSYYGGAIFSTTDATSHGDTFTKNTAEAYGGALYVNDGDIDLTGSMIHDNKAGIGGNDIYASDTLGSLILPDASEMGGAATFGNAEVEVDGWYTDGDDDRYAPDHITEEKFAYTPGEYLLITAGKGNKAKLSYNNDGDAATALRVKFLPIGAKIKLDPNGGEVEEDEIVVEEDIEVPDPIYKDHGFTGWNPDEADGYDYALKASWNKTADDESSEATDESETSNKTDNNPKDELNPDAPDTIDIITLSTILFSLCAVGLGFVASIAKKTL